MLNSRFYNIVCYSCLQLLIHNIKITLKRLFSCYINNSYIVKSVIRINNQSIILYICNICNFETKNNNKLTQYFNKYLII